METGFFARVRAWNDRMNDLPRKALVIACVLLCLWGFLKIFPLIAPFVVALALSLLISPLVNLLIKLGRKLRFPRSLATLIAMILVFGVLVLIITLITGRAMVELKELARALPSRISEWVGQLNGAIDNLTLWIDSRVDIINDESIATIRGYITQLNQSLLSYASQLANAIARGALNTAISVPQIVLFIVLSILGTFYMVSDRDRIVGYFTKMLPARASSLLGVMKQGMFRAILGQMRAQMFLTVMMFCELLLGFSIMRIPYALLLAVVIALLDMLPVVGSGLFLIPWAAFGLISGDYFTGVGMLLLYGITIVMRQLIEPRVVGAQLGLYPLATMMSMYAGYVLFGFLGMLLGPMTFMLCRVAVYAVCGTPTPVTLAPPPARQMFQNIAKKK